MKYKPFTLLALSCMALVACSPTTSSSSSSLTTDKTETSDTSSESTSNPSSTTSQDDDKIEKIDVTNKNHLNWFGRTYSKDGKQYFHYSSSGFEVKFYGTKLEATIGATEFSSDKNRPYLSILVDGENDPRKAKDLALTEEIAVYTIIDNLEEGFHTVRVLKRSESQYSKCWLEDLITDGSFYKPNPKKERKIEIYGASTTCGYGAFGKSGPEAFKTETEHSLFSYAGLISRVFDAEYNMVSASGWAITQNKDSDDVCMPEVYDKVDLRSEMKWDFNEFVPDIVIINLATNDSVYINDAPTIEEKQAREKRYYDGYIRFIDNLREAYNNPELPILMTYGFLDDQGVEKPIHDIKAYYAKKGDAYVDYLKVIKANGTDGFGSRYHPSATTHMRSTDLMIPKVQELMDYEWDVKYPNITSVK